MTLSRPNHPAPSRRRRGLALFACAFWLPALVAQSQPATNSGANSQPLPLRNIQIEVRQVQQLQRERPLQQDQQSSSAQQQVLVLNGRSAAIALRNSQPFRLMQTQFRNGVPVLVSGVVLLDATTGFWATPRWNGADTVELELAATQAGSAAGRGGAPTSTSAQSALLLPLGEWVVVAESDVESQSGGGSRQQRSELQVRLSVR